MLFARRQRHGGPVRPDPDGAGELQERHLLQAVVRGEREAFDTLYRLYYPRLARFLERLTRRPALVEELLDDTLLLVWQRGQAFNGQSKVSTWIFGIAYRKAMKALSRLDEPPDGGEAWLEDEAAAPRDGPEQRMDLRQLQLRLQRALGSLSAEHRAVVELCYFQDLGYRDIAAIVDCPPETVKTRMFYARRRLRAQLADLWPESPLDVEGER